MIDNPHDAAIELLKRRRSQTSLHSFALNVDIPGAPMPALCPDEDLLGPAHTLMAGHHAVMLDHIERTMNTPYGRLMIFAPPGSAKSSYASVVAPAWDMARPLPPHRSGDGRIILASYADKIARKQSRRCQAICKSERYKTLWDEPVTVDREATDDWSLSNGSEFMAAGIMGGITGNRAHGVIIDDPVAGREEADSEQIRQKTLDGYQDDVTTRFLPGAYVILIMTRWHELDLAGQLLPEGYDGRSGFVRCSDGLDWYVLNIPAKAERADDPLGRSPGEYLWTEWFPPRHWQTIEQAQAREARRTWSSLYQQRPTPEGGGDFRRGMFNWYTPGEEPMSLNLYGASDYAVTEKAGDFTEHGVAGLDSDNNLWFLDWWSGQVETDKGIEAFLDLVARHKPLLWVNEGGVIDKSVRPAINRRMRERAVYVDLRTLSSIKDKRAKCRSFGARAGAGSIWLPKGQVWAQELVEQLVAMPAGRYDDKADVAGLLGRMIDKFVDARPPPDKRPRGVKPFTGAWLEWEPPKNDEVCYR